MADRPVHPPRAQPELLGQPGLRRRGRHHHLQDRRHHGPGAQGGRARLRARPQLRSAQSAEDRSEHRDGRGQRQWLVAARVQHIRGEQRQDDPERRTVDHGPARPDVPRRARVRRRPPGARRPGPRRLWRRGHDDRAAGPDPVARRADHAADLRHRAGEAEARRRGLRARQRRQSPGQGGQADQPAAVHAGLGRQLSEGGAVHRGLVRTARGQGHDPGVQLGCPDGDHLSAGGRREVHRGLRHRAVGLERWR